MSTVSVTAVRAWQPDALQSAADQLAIATTTLDDEVNEVRKAMDRATTEWRGPAAEAATERTRRELTDGQALVEALRTAKAALATGVLDIGIARTSLLTAVDSAVLAGLRVADDGGVVAPALPPVMSSPEHAPAAAAQRIAQQTELECQAGTRAQAIDDALRAVAEADQRTADALMRVEVPASMRAEVDELMRDLVVGGGLAGGLAWAAGGARVGQVGIKAFGVLKKFLALAGREADVFHYGAANGGFLRFMMGTRGAKLVGRAFLPLTVATGAWDAVTGGGYEGARGWATRGFGAAGAVGAGALMIMGPAALASNPVGWAIAAGAVTAYGAWSLGNLVYDHREAIADFAGKTVEWGGDATQAGWNATTNAVSGATQWAGDRLGDAADLGKNLLGKVHVPDLNPF